MLFRSALAQETVALRREIVKRKPADTSRREALADALLRLGIGLALGMHPDALPALREAEQITRELAKASPAFKANLAEVLTELGRFCPLQSCATGEGLAAAREAVQIYRPLAISTPALQVNLAEALTATAVEYMALTQPQLALAPIQEAVAITGAMTNTTPASRNARATALVLQAQILSLLKQPTKPVKAAKEATPKGPEGMGADADPIQKMADASLRLQNAINFTELGQWDRALQASLEAVDQLRD